MLFLLDQAWISVDQKPVITRAGWLSTQFYSKMYFDYFKASSSKNNGFFF